jgi:hypothetical protein
MAPDIARLLTDNGIFPPHYEPNRYYLTCPHCSATRQLPHQKLKCLSLMIEADKAYWKCHNCNWIGPEASGKNSFDDRIRYEYPGGNFKIRNPKGRTPPYVWEHENDHGQIVSGANNLGAALYRLEEAIARGGLIAVVEGEKDADNLWRHGFPAITSPHGAAKPGQRPKWTTEHSRQLAGLEIVVLNDNDPAGYEHAKAVVDCSHGIAKSIRRLDLKDHWSDIPVNGDISDFLESLHSTDYPGDEWVRDLLEDAPLINGKGSLGPLPAPPQPTKKTFASLMTETFAPLKWVIPRYIPEGVTLLAGKPKIGKSWLVLATALACVRSGQMLDQTCPKQIVLHCALEDTERRLHGRTQTLIGDDREDLEDYFYELEIPRLDKGCAAYLKQRIAEDHINLIIIDTLAAVASPKGKDETQNAADYRNIAELTKLAHETGVSIIIVHHLRKQGSEDKFDMISGTLGIAAAADHLIVLDREGVELRLSTRGRDAEPEDKLVDFDSEMGEWTITGDYEPEDTGIGKTRQTILAALGTEVSSMKPAEVAKMTGIKLGTVQQTLRRMTKAGEIKRTGYGTYHV